MAECPSDARNFNGNGSLPDGVVRKRKTGTPGEGKCAGKSKHAFWFRLQKLALLSFSDRKHVFHRRRCGHLPKRKTIFKPGSEILTGARRKHNVYRFRGEH